MIDVQPERIPSLAIFDLGNVVFNISWQPMFESWARCSGVGASTLAERFTVDEPFKRFETGELASRDYHVHLCKTLRAKLSYDEFVAGWNAIYGEVREDAESALRHIDGKVRAVALTNTTEVHRVVWSQRYRDVLKGFERIYVSSQLGLRKPDARIFHHVLDDCRVAPRDAIFFDDHLTNVDAAKHLGLRAVLVDSPHAIMDALRELGLAAQSFNREKRTEE